MINAVNIEHDEKATEAVQYLSKYCKEHPNCKGCFMSFSHVCILKWTEPGQWDKSLTKLMERRTKNGCTR